MTGNVNNTEVTVAAPEVNRLRASSPILILAILFVAGAFLTWYFTWFGRELSDSEISKYLVDEGHPRRVQHALLQIQQRIERPDGSAKQWYPQIIGLAGNSETEYRLTIAWLMGFDNKSEEFHEALLKLHADSEPIVRRNAALALVRFGDSTGRGELRAMLEASAVRATGEGIVTSTLRQGSQISRGALLARILQGDSKVIETRSPLTGTVENVAVQNGSKITAGELILTLRPDEESVWEALRGLSLVGEKDDLPVVERYAQGVEPTSERLKQQAALTAQTIQSRLD